VSSRASDAALLHFAARRGLSLRVQGSPQIEPGAPSFAVLPFAKGGLQFRLIRLPSAKKQTTFGPSIANAGCRMASRQFSQGFSRSLREATPKASFLFRARCIEERLVGRGFNRDKKTLREAPSSRGAVPASLRLFMRHPLNAPSPPPPRPEPPESYSRVSAPYLPLDAHTRPLR
jgi:hypothetical protein